jgi:hypothetical protein
MNCARPLDSNQVTVVLASGLLPAVHCLSANFHCFVALRVFRHEDAPFETEQISKRPGLKNFATGDVNSGRSECCV